MPRYDCCGYTDDDKDALCPKCGKAMKLFTEPVNQKIVAKSKVVPVKKPKKRKTLLKKIMGG